MTDLLSTGASVEPGGPQGPPLQLLAPDGTRRDHAELGDDVGPDRLLAALRLMRRTRRLDRELVHLQRQGELALYPPCEGQEGVQVGSALALAEADWAFPQYRELGLAVARDLDPAGWAQLWRGHRHGGHDPVATRVALPTIPIGTHLPHAVGVALGLKLRRSSAAVLAYLGDGATSTGDAHEAMTFAGVWRVPCVFLITNNGWAISTPLEHQTAAPTLAAKGIGYGLPALRVDGNDVLACLAATAWALDHARRGGGPVLLEAVTYRMGAHTTSDDPTRYRGADELERWRRLDPIERVERHLGALGRWGEEERRRAEQEEDEAVRALRAGVVGLEPPPVAELFEHVYVDAPPRLRRQAASVTGEVRSWA